MGFKVTARTILQLGAELISSDAIAFYELIKNAFDAESQTVEVRIVKRLEFGFIEEKLTELDRKSIDNSELEQIKQEVLRHTINDSYRLEEYISLIENSSTKEKLKKRIERSNYILFRDKGTGMSLDDLDSIYLTIGTRYRLKEQGYILQDSGDPRPKLGEKGIGRLSAMRLGDGLRVVTSKKGEINYNELKIDWSVFSHSSDELLENIDIRPNIGKKKDDPEVSGTDIYIYKLNREWRKEDLQQIAHQQLSKFTDPFEKKNHNFMKLWFNNEPVIIPTMKRLLFDHAHAIVEGQLSFSEGNPVLSGLIDYKLYNRQKAILVEGTHLSNIVRNISNLSLLKNLGPFSFKFYWYNNRIVKEIDGIGTITEVRALIKSWAGGLMVYRDGFRVFPYGSLDDDWLQLDPTAFSKGGYKANRRQIIGKVEITSRNNPALIDQTNREGLRDSPEKKALILILQHILWAEFTPLLNKTEKELLTARPLDLDDIEERLLKNEERLVDNLNFLVAKFPEINEEEKTVRTIREALMLNKSLLNDIRDERKSVKQKMEVTLHLAGLGLMVDIIAHELNRSTEHTIRTLNETSVYNLSDQTKSLFRSLESQLKTIRTRLKVLDPISQPGRQTKEFFDVYELVADLFNAHQMQFERHHISSDIEPKALSWRIRAVRGMIIQIVENLTANSVYWLKQHKSLHPDHRAKINVFLDKDAQCIYFTDNGPGIPSQLKEEVFLPFVTTKPPGEGKGLGLYISREIAKYHGASLDLVENDFDNQRYLHTFRLNLTGIK